MTYFQNGFKSIALFGVLLCVAGLARAEDIDLFIGSKDSSSGAGLPNVIFVLDNTSNWARQAQQWPGLAPDGTALTQGQSEARALKIVMDDVMTKIQAETVTGLNVGLIEITTSGNANQDGGFVRFALQELTPSSKVNLDTQLDKIFNNINAATEKRNSNTPYGNLMYDVYNYLAGGKQSFTGGGTESTIADPDGYTSQYDTFKSPLSSSALCAKTYVIFIGNPDQSGPSGDSATNSAALKALYLEAGANVEDLNGFAGGSSPLPLPLPKFTVTTEAEPSVKLGYSNACYSTKNNDSAASIASCKTAEALSGGLCSGKSNCSCDIADTSAGSCGKNTAKLQVIEGGQTSTVVTPVSNSYDTTAGRAWNMDDWSKFLFSYGIPITQTNEQGPSYIERAPVITFAIDVFNKQQSDTQTALMLSASKLVGGGQYYAAKNEDAIVDAISDALSNIISESSVFAAATLPLSATSQGLSENQVYLGMFRPDQQARPRWYGNLKRYQFAIYNGNPGLADADFKPAVNTSTGFVGECARSFWTTNTNAYWDGLGIIPAPLSRCLSSTFSPWSDAPDGPFVEKGAAALVSRNGTLSGRKVLAMNSMTAVSATSVGGTNVLNYLIGTQTGADNEIKNASDDGRPSLQGDVVHSRPLTINYGAAKPTYIFYGSNDGLYRAVEASNGSESWALIAPEHYAGIARLYQNSPNIAFPNQDLTETPLPLPKQYFMDGSTGQYIEYDKDRNVTKAWIYPTMRRGGSMVYALDVTEPADPEYKWAFDAKGQTWSLPISANVAGYTTNPILMFGGGFDDCVDKDDKTNTCGSSSKGSVVYVLDANTGAKLAEWPTGGPVVGDVAPVDSDGDGKVDFAYVADATGGVWRVNFAEMATNGSLTVLNKDSWSITKVANSANTSLRFINTPTVLAVSDRVYIGLGSGNRERPLETNYPYEENVKDRFYAFVDFPAATSSALDLNGDKMLDVTPGSGVSCDAKGPRGWSVGMSGQGEQIVSPGVIGAGNIFFNSYQPGGGSNAGGSCRPLGTGTSYKVNLLSPACSVDKTQVKNDGMPIAPTIVTVLAPVCSTDGTCSGEEKQVTVCIGCGGGVDPIQIIGSPPASRQRTFFGGDVDR